VRGFNDAQSAKLISALISVCKRQAEALEFAKFDLKMALETQGFNMRAIPNIETAQSDVAEILKGVVDDKG